MNNAEALSENSQSVFDSMALWNQGIISRDNILGIDNSKGNLISREKISGIDNSGNNLSLENEEKVKAKAKAEAEAEAEAEAKEKTEDARADGEAKTRAEAEAKAKEDQLKRNFNLIKSQLINEHHNLSRHQRLHPEEKMDIKDLGSYIKSRLRSTKCLYVKLKSEEYQARHRVLDTSLLAKRSMWVELINLTLQARQTAEILYKKLLADQMCKTKEDLEAYNILKSEQQEEDEVVDIIKAEQAQAITEQDGKSEQQEQDESNDIIKTEQAQGITELDGKSEQQEQDEAEQAQAVTEQDFKSEQQQQYEAKGIIRAEQAQGIAKEDGKSEQDEQEEAHDSIKPEEAQDITKKDGKLEQEQDEAHDIIKTEQAEGINKQDGKPIEELTNDKEEADQVEPSTEEKNRIEEILQGKKQSTHGNEVDQEEDQCKPPNEEQNKIDKEVCGKRTSDKEEEVQTNIMQVAESTDAQEKDQKVDQEAKLVEPSNEEQNRIEEKLQGNRQSTYNIEVDQEEDQESGQAGDQGKSSNKGQNRSEEEVQGKMIEVEEATNASEDQKAGQDKRSKYGFIDAIITNTEVPTGKIKIKYDVSQPRSLLSRKMANSLRTCFKCNDSNIAFVNLCVPSMYGFSYIQWHFDTSKNLKDECVLGQDYLMDRNTSPLMLYRIMNLASQK